MRNLVQKGLEFPQMLDEELDLVKVEYLFEHLTLSESKITALIYIIPT